MITHVQLQQQNTQATPRHISEVLGIVLARYLDRTPLLLPAAPRKGVPSRCARRQKERLI
jgi:hypothetical protein